MLRTFPSLDIFCIWGLFQDPTRRIHEAIAPVVVWGSNQGVC